jgi:anion-transporting  ArsA/GET3 family ATPase
MTTSEQEVPEALFKRQGLECKGSLYAMMLDTKRTFDALVEKYASDEEARDRILENQIYQYVASSLAGTQEYMAMEKLHEVRKDPQWDLVVLDTPPTSSALDFLAAPERLVDAIDSPAMRWFLQVFEGAGKEAFGLVGRGATVLLRGIGRITGIEFLEQVAQFVGGINDLFGGFKERATQVSDALRSPEVAFVLVTSPDPMSISEARFFSDKLEEAGMNREAIIVNQVHSLIDTPTISTEEQVSALSDVVPQSIDAAHLQPRLATALDLERTWAENDHAQVARLAEEIGAETRIVEVPSFDQDVHDLAALTQVAGYLTGSA